MRMDLDFDPVGVVLTAQACGGASPPQAWGSDKKTPPPCRGGSLANDCGMVISSERPLQGRGVVGLCTQAYGGEAPPPAWAVRTTPTGSKSKSILIMKASTGGNFISKLRNWPKIKEKILYNVALRGKRLGGRCEITGADTRNTQ